MTCDTLGPRYPRPSMLTGPAPKYAIRSAAPSIDTFFANIAGEQRRRQLNLMAKLRQEIGARPHRREDDAILLYTLERAGDAIAHNELPALGLNSKSVIKSLEENVAEALS